VHGPAGISDIELSAACSGDGGPPPILPLLQYKIMVEGRLNEALRRLRAER
jgi:hypothetical protein